MFVSRIVLPCFCFQGCTNWSLIIKHQRTPQFWKCYKCNSLSISVIEQVQKIKKTVWVLNHRTNIIWVLRLKTRTIISSFEREMKQCAFQRMMGGDVNSHDLMSSLFLKTGELTTCPDRLTLFILIPVLFIANCINLNKNLNLYVLFFFLPLRPFVFSRIKWIK